MYAAVIYDKMNIISRVETRNTREKAIKAGQFYTMYKTGWWYRVIEGTEEIEMTKCMINL